MNISILVDSFLKQNIQSEAEVRSKFIVPLLELLEYPSDLRAEEFPVYGFEGGKPLRAKAADFLQFTSNEFHMHREKKDEDLEWVYKHSLLVFEAKKPTEGILVKGQPVFYSAWTKSVAYIISNGVNIEGYLTNANYSDVCVFSCAIKDIPKRWEEINLLNYHRVMELKSKADSYGKWTNRDLYDVYKNEMRVRCINELYASVDRSLEEISYDLNIVREGESKDYHDILDKTCKIITSEPGGGKSYLMWMLMREYLMAYSENDEKIPIMLEGRYFGKVYYSIEEGIYKELNLMLPFLTKEMIEKRLREGGFVILFDALDEVEYNYDVLTYELHQLRRNTDNIIVVTSRIQNYKRDFCVDFIHYSLEPLSDDRIIELLKKYSCGKMNVQIHQIPKRLLEIIRTPLFLKMFVTISKREAEYRIPSNYAALFELFIAEKASALSCTLFEETIIKRILGEYAADSYENGDSTEKFFEILEKNCESQNKTRIYELIWKTGLIAEGLQGIKYFHKAIQEFFVAIYVSNFEDSELDKWLNSTMSKEKYGEVICYLVGIKSNHKKQNSVLDYLEVHNLQLYSNALKARRNFEVIDQELNLEYAKKYYAQILKTYCNIICTFFYNIYRVFDGYSRNGKGRVCIRGDISYANRSIFLIIYNGDLDTQQLNISVSDKNEIRMMLPNGESIPMFSSVFTNGNIHERYYNLEMLMYGFDSSREIAFDIIKKQIKAAMNQKILFDTNVEVLLAERVENELKKLRNRCSKDLNKEMFSLYSNNIGDVIENVKKLGIYNREVDMIITLCKVLALQMDNAERFLDLKPDLKFGTGRNSYRYDELYSNQHLVKKVKKILLLFQEAIKTIITNIVPVLSTIKPNTRIIGIVHRKGKHAGVDYINVKIEDDKEYEPIIEFREESISMFPETDKYYLNQLKKIGKSEQDIINGSSSLLLVYFEKNLFHKMIYEEVEDLFEQLLGKL